jgi:hypothetical protein
MHLCPRCGVAYLPDEHHVCGDDAHWREQHPPRAFDWSPFLVSVLVTAAIVMADRVLSQWLPPILSDQWGWTVRLPLLAIPCAVANRHLGRASVVGVFVFSAFVGVINDRLLFRDDWFARFVVNGTFVLAFALFVLFARRRHGLTDAP